MVQNVSFKYTEDAVSARVGSVSLKYTEDGVSARVGSGGRGALHKVTSAGSESLLSVLSSLLHHELWGIFRCGSWGASFGDAVAPLRGAGRKSDQPGWWWVEAGGWSLPPELPPSTVLLLRW